MKRITFRILLCTLLGVITSVAVAWGCAWRFHQIVRSAAPPEIERTIPSSSRENGHWMWMLETESTGSAARVKIQIIEVIELRETTLLFYEDHEPPVWSTPAIASVTNAQRLPVFELVAPYRMDSTGMAAWIKLGRTGSVTEFAAGWPLLAVCCTYPIEFPADPNNWGPPPPSYNVGLGGGIAMGEWPDSDVGQIPTVLPYSPIWPGLLANTAIYGSAWWAMLFGPGMLIRWRRRRAGRCAKCGYDLRGSASDACPACGADHT